MLYIYIYIYENSSTSVLSYVKRLDKFFNTCVTYKILTNNTYYTTAIAILN